MFYSNFQFASMLKSLKTVENVNEKVLVMHLESQKNHSRVTVDDEGYIFLSLLQMCF